jgi:hypothetical protein
MKPSLSIKRTTTVLAASVLLSVVNSTQAALVANEPFDFSGSFIGGLGSGTGWGTNLWSSTPAPGLAMSADGTSLAYPAGSSFAVSGQRVLATNTGGINSTRLLNSSFSLANGNGSYYMSFLAEKDATGLFRWEANNSANQIRWAVSVAANVSRSNGFDPCHLHA